MFFLAAAGNDQGKKKTNETTEQVPTKILLINLRYGNEKSFSFVISKESSILCCEVVAYLVEECNIETSCHVRAGIR